MDKYITYNTTTELHRELTNILLLSIEEDSYFYCYCGEENGECGICSLAIFLVDVHHQNKIDGLSPRKFLAKNHNNKEKLELFASKISCFFDKIDKENKTSLEFFQRNYSWSLKVYSTGETLTVDLQDSIDNEILQAENDVDDDDYGIYS